MFFSYFSWNHADYSLLFTDLPPIIQKTTLAGKTGSALLLPYCKSVLEN